MTTKDDLLYERIRQLEDDVTDLQARLSRYDILAAKWGGMCMLAVALGGTIFTYSDKVVAFLTSIGKKP